MGIGKGFLPLIVVVLILGATVLFSVAFGAEQSDASREEVVRACKECVAQHARRYEGNADYDCADLALQVLAECAWELGLRLQIPVWQSEGGRWIVFRSSAYTSKEDFTADLQKSVPASGLFDRDRVTRPKPLESLVPGDLVLYDLQSHRDRDPRVRYTSHTMIVLENDRPAKKMEVIEAHQARLPAEIKRYTYDQIRVKRFQLGDAEGKPREWNFSEIVESWPSRTQRPRQPASPSRRQVRPASGAGIEAYPPSAVVRCLTSSAIPTGDRPSFGLGELLPSSGPEGTQPFRVIPRQTLRSNLAAEGVGNAEEAYGVDYRSDGEDERTTVAAVLLTRTFPDVYKHDYHVCARFRGFVAHQVRPLEMAEPRTAALQSVPSWFWFSRIHDHRSGTTEAAYHFAVFVYESRHEFVVDSRWIDKQYAPYWRASNAPHDYVLNFQVWSSCELYSRRLLHSILANLRSRGGPWKVTFANRVEPQSAGVFIEAARLAGDVVEIYAWNRLATSCMAVFHGTKRATPEGEDVFFEFWEPLQPGRNFVKLPVGRIHNAVVHCEVEGFIDKVFVSMDESNPLPALPAPAARIAGQRVGGLGSNVKVSWPPNNAKVVVLRDQLDMPGDHRLAIHGTVSGAPARSGVFVSVLTNEWYQQGFATVRDGLWGFRVHLEGKEEDGFNNHEILVRLVDEQGKEITRDSVKGIVRVEPGAKGGAAPGARPLAPVTIKADAFQGDGGVHVEGSGVMIVGGDTDGPHGRGGSASARVELPDDASTMQLKMSIWHGNPTELGKGVHSKAAGGKVTIYLNDVPVHAIVCQHRGMHGDFWPEQQPELGRELPEINLAAKGVKGRSLTIKIVASPWTCTDLRSVTIQPSPAGR